MSTDMLKLSSTLFSTIQSNIELKETDFTNVKEMNEFKLKNVDNSAEYEGKSSWFDETKGSKLTGISKYFYHSKEDSNYGIHGWLGPGLAVPHMILNLGHCGSETDGNYWIETDYIPRGPFPFGSDPSYLELYYKHEMNSNSLPTYRTSKFHSKPSKLNFYSRILQSPAYFSATSLSLQNINDISTQHVDRWIKWLGESKPLEARQKAGFNSRDDKLRQFAFTSSLYEYSLKFGPGPGKSIAAAFTGPIAEAYIGGGS